MAAITVPSGLSIQSAPSLNQNRTTCSSRQLGVNGTCWTVGVGSASSMRRLSVRAQYSGPDSGEGEPAGSSSEGVVKKKKGIKREEEPEQFWKTQAEIDGQNPMQTLLPYVAILGLLTPFIILGIAFSAGYIKTPNY